MLQVAKEPAERKAHTIDPLFSHANVAETRRAVAWLNDRIARASPANPITEVVDLTPVMAELLLERNPENRHLRDSRVAEYTIDITNGDWEFNGENIKVSADGRLNDGQHRCHAVIRAGRAIRTAIMFGLERDSRMTVDQGAVRTLGNYLTMDGHKRANILAATASLVYQYETSGRIMSGGRGKPTKVQARRIVEQRPELIDSVEAIPRGGRIASSPAVLAFCHHVFARRAGASAATSFILSLSLGDGLPASSPIYRAREKLLVEGKRLRAWEKVELIFRTWNAWRRGKKQTKASPILGDLPTLER